MTWRLLVCVWVINCHTINTKTPLTLSIHPYICICCIGEATSPASTADWVALARAVADCASQVCGSLRCCSGETSYVPWSVRAIRSYLAHYSPGLLRCLPRSEGRLRRGPHRARAMTSRPALRLTADRGLANCGPWTGKLWTVDWQSVDRGLANCGP